MQKSGFDIIGTHLEVTIDTDDDISELMQEVQLRLSCFEQKYSRFIPGNWLHTLNIERTGILDEDGQAMLSTILSVAHNTDGYFDPTVAKRLTELGYGNMIISRVNPSLKVGYGDYRDIELDGNKVILHGNIELEFGGVGKGYLIDVIRNIIDRYGHFLINFGGDMYGRGSWQIGLENPFASDEIIGVIQLDDIFFACSAGTKRKWGDHHHLIDPHTGVSAREVIANYIEGDSGIVTDAYATALCVMPWNLACEILQKTPEISGVIVRQDGHIFQKEGSRAEVFE